MIFMGVYYYMSNHEINIYNWYNLHAELIANTKNSDSKARE